jgi:hypothetical protein
MERLGKKAQSTIVSAPAVFQRRGRWPVASEIPTNHISLQYSMELLRWDTIHHASPGVDATLQHW